MFELKKKMLRPDFQTIVLALEKAPETEPYEDFTQIRILFKGSLRRAVSGTNRTQTISKVKPQKD